MSPIPLIFAFGWTNLPMLGWLAAAAAPVLIHLWSRRKYREMSWAAMEYLLAAMQRQKRRLRFEQLLLLILRTLLIVLLVVAVAEPYFEQIGAALTSAGRTHRVLVIDGSYSMGYTVDGSSRFDRAKQLARQIVESSRQGDAHTLVLMADPPQAVVETPALDREEMLQEIDSLQMPHTTADLPSTTAMVHKIVDGARRENRHLTGHEVYFLTDLGRVGWKPRLTDASLAEFQKRTKQLSQLASLVIIDLGQPETENIAVTELRTLETVHTPAQEISLEATLKNFGRRPRPAQSVELLIDGRPVEQKTVDVPPAGEASIGFSHRPETPGDHQVEIRTAGDALDVDNHRWLALPVRQAIRVLCVDGRPSGEPFRGAADYLAYALAPQDEASPRAMVQAEIVTESALLERDLAPYDCVLLCDVAQFTASEARVLDGYVANGGNLVFFLGPSVLVDRYNEVLGGSGPADGESRRRLLPARLGPLVDKPVWRLDPMEYAHPIVRPFRGREEAGLLTTPVYQYIKATVPDNGDARIVLKTSTGDPLIVEEPIGRGRVVLVTTSADASWTDMPAWPSYVPIVHELLTFCVGGQLQQQNVRVGQLLIASLSSPTGKVPALLQGPDGRSRQLQLRPEGDYSLLSYADTSISGIYTVRFGSPIDTARSFAVNVDTIESDLTPLSVDQLRDEVWPGIPFVHETTWQDFSRQPTGPITRVESWPVNLLYLVLGLLFVETYLAWRFGYHTQ